MASVRSKGHSHDSRGSQEFGSQGVLHGLAEIESAFAEESGLAFTSACVSAPSGVEICPGFLYHHCLFLSPTAMVWTGGVLPVDLYYGE